MQHHDNQAVRGERSLCKTAFEEYSGDGKQDFSDTWGAAIGRLRTELISGIELLDVRIGESAMKLDRIRKVADFLIIMGSGVAIALLVFGAMFSLDSLLGLHRGNS